VFQTEPFQRISQFKPRPVYTDESRVCFRPSCTRHMLGVPALCRGRLRQDAPPWRLGSPPPQGSSLRTGLCCPSPSSLNRPHPPHSPAIATSPPGGLYAMPSLCGSALSDPRVVPCFRFRSFWTCRPLRPRGARRLHMPSSFTDGAGLHRVWHSSALPSSHHPLPIGVRFSRLLRFALCCGLSSRSPPLADLTGGYPANRGFYFRASDRSVTLPIAGYNYGDNWASFTGGTFTHRNVS
jgi:hypothetical protein